MRIFKIIFLLFISNQSFSYEIALTIDDIPITGNIPEVKNKVEIVSDILTTIKNHNIPVYGFATGSSIENNRDLMQLWISSGIKIGNHSFYHKDAAKTSIDEIIEDIDKADVLLKSILGYKPKYYRYPFLSEGDSLKKRKTIRNHLHNNAYKIAPVTIDTKDWSFTDETCYINYVMKEIRMMSKLSKLLFKRDIKHIILIHSNYINSIALNKLILTMKENGVKFIPLDKAMSDPVYQVDTNFVGDYGVTFLIQKAIMLNIDFSKEIKIDNNKIICNIKNEV